MHICVLRSGPQEISAVEKFCSTEVCKTASKMVWGAEDSQLLLQEEQCGCSAAPDLGYGDKS